MNQPFIRKETAVDLHEIPRCERADELIRGMVERAEEFWEQRVLAGVPPEPRSAEDAARLWRRDSGELQAIDESTDLLVALNELRSLRSLAKQTDTHIEQLSDALKLAIGPASGLSIGGQPVCTWKAAKDSTAVNWQAIANDIGATVAPDVLAAAIQRHTTTKPGSRRFLVRD